MADISPMVQGDWRLRLRAAIVESGKSFREISLAAGRAGGYVHSILEDGKEPALSSFVAVCDQVPIAVTKVLYGLEMSPEAERLLRLYARLSPDQQADFLQMAESIARVAQKT